MFCTHCGKQIADSTKFCGFCGGEQIPLEQNRVTVEEQVPPAPAPAPMQYSQQSQYQQPPVQQPYVPYSGYYAPDGTPLVPAQAQYPMKWFKFQIYFMFFVNAIAYLGEAIIAIFGVDYVLAGFEPEFVYSISENLRIVDVCFGITNLAFAALSIIIRFQLSGFKRNAPKMFCIFIAVETVFLIIYAIAYSVVYESLPVAVPVRDVSADIGVILGTVCALIVNYTYYKKRRSLFVN